MICIKYLPHFGHIHFAKSSQVLFPQMQTNSYRTLVALHNINCINAKWLQWWYGQSVVALRVALNDASGYAS